MNINDDPDAPHQPSHPRSDLETRLMREALADTEDVENRGRRLLETIPDANPNMPHQCGGLDPEIKAAVERITGKECVGPALSTGEHSAPNAAMARSMLKRWAVAWHGYLRS